MARKILIAIVMFGIVLRLVRVTESPPALNWDEVALGYNAYSLSQTAKDEYGYKLPLHLRSFDDYKPAVYSYFTAPVVAYWGLTELTVRIVSVISGSLVIVFLFFITKEITKKESVAFVTAALAAIEPWSVFFSRAAFEANLALVLYLLSLLFFLKCRKNIWVFTLSILILGLSTFSYHAEKVLFIPTIFVYFVLYLKNNGYTRKAIIPLFLSVFLLLIYIFSFDTLARFSSTSILSVWQHDKNVFRFLIQVAAHYLAYFSPANLFVRGSPEPTQRIPGFSVFYVFEFFFWIIGIVSVFSKAKKLYFLLIFTLIAPLPAVITWNWFYPARILPLFALFTIYIGIGVVEFYTILKKLSVPTRFFTAATILFYITMSIGHFLLALYFSFPFTEGGAWQYGMKEIVEAATPYASHYKSVVWETRTAQPHIFWLFYSKYDPKAYHNEIRELANTKSPRQTYNFGKFEFRDVYWPRSDEYKRNILLIGPASSLPEEKVKQNPDVDLFLKVEDKYGNIIGHIVGIN